MTKVAILPGFAEGDWHSKALRSALIAAGFSVVANPHDADAVITHSGGGIVVPDTTADITLHVNPTWPKQPFMKSFTEKIWRDMQAHRADKKLGLWFIKTGWHTWYIFTRMPRNVRMLRHLHKIQYLTPTSQTIVVRNQFDPWCSPAIMNDITKPGTTFISLPGEHDDIWTNPQPYIKLLQSLI